MTNPSPERSEQPVGEPVPGGEQTYDITNADGGITSLRESELPAFFESLMTIDNITMSYSRKLNTENRYQKFSGEDHFESINIDMSRAWKIISNKAMADPETGRVLRVRFAQAMKSKLGNASRYIYRNVLRKTLDRANQLQLSSASYIQEEYQDFIRGAPGAYDPFEVVPKPQPPK